MRHRYAMALAAAASLVLIVTPAVASAAGNTTTPTPTASTPAVQWESQAGSGAISNNNLAPGQTRKATWTQGPETVTVTVTRLTPDQMTSLENKGEIPLATGGGGGECQGWADTVGIDVSYNGPVGSYYWEGQAYWSYSCSTPTVVYATNPQVIDASAIYPYAFVSSPSASISGNGTDMPSLFTSAIVGLQAPGLGYLCQGEAWGQLTYDLITGLFEPIWSSAACPS